MTLFRISLILAAASIASFGIFSNASLADLSCTAQCQYNEDYAPYPCEYMSTCTWNGNCVTYTYCTAFADYSPHPCISQAQTTQCSDGRSW